MTRSDKAPRQDSLASATGDSSGGGRHTGGRGGRWPVRLAAIGGALAVPVATWWLIGDQTASVAPGTQLDYIVRPMAVAAPVETGVGGAAALVTVAAVGYLGMASRRRRLDRRWWATLVPVLAAGAIVGASWRAITMGTVGANIGGGLAILFGGALTAALLLWALIWSGWLLTKGRSRPVSR